jgi:hypothetical protein
LGAIICDFGRNQDGLYLYRVNGDKKEIEKYIDELKNLGCEFFDSIELEKSHKSFSVLLRIKFPPEVDERLQEQKRELEERQRKSFEERDRIRGKKN